MDGTFPNHEPDPTVMENLVDLRNLVLRERLDVGVAYDGDGDRLGVIDHRGEVVFGDKLMIIFAREILSRRPGSVIISEVKCSKTLYDDIERQGGHAIMWKTGHSLIKAKMKEVDAQLAGEMSGHIFFKDRYFGFDDGIYASCRLLEVLSRSGKRIPELLDGVPAMHATPEIRIECPDEIKFEVVDRAQREFKEKNLEVIDIDGARITFPDGWGLVRASNTQPVLVFALKPKPWTGWVRSGSDRVDDRTDKGRFLTPSLWCLNFRVFSSRRMQGAVTGYFCASHPVFPTASFRRYPGQGPIHLHRTAPLP